MDKNDPFNRPGGHEDGAHGDGHEFDDDARYDDPHATGVREEEYAAGQEEWDQPIDEFAEEPQAGPRETLKKRDPFVDESPLEDEFADHAHDDHDGSEHELDDHDLEEPSVTTPRSGASSVAGMKPPFSVMKYIPYIGGGLAAVVIAFFGFQQFAGDSSVPPSQPSLENQNTWDAASANPTQQQPQQAANEFQQPAPVNMITPTAIPAVDPAQNVQAPLPQAAPLVQPQAPNPLEARINELTQQLETMKQTQDQLNQKLQTATATPPDASHALEERMAQLEQKLNTQSASAVAAPSVDAPSAKSSRKTKASKKSSTDFVVAKKSRRAKKSSKSSVEVNSTAGTNGAMPLNSRPVQGWILRSAQPGSAWLSQGPYSSDLRRVVPGDKVQGLGTVTAVRQVAGRWVVEGTQGAVR